MNTAHPLAKIITPILALVISVACMCGPLTPTEPTPAPTATEDTSAPAEPTATTEAAAPDSPTDTPEAQTSGNDLFFTETFDDSSNINNFSYFEFHDSQEDVAPKIKDGALVFDLQKANQWVYVTYDPSTYDDVTVSLKADNRGKNNNNVSIICRYSDEGWYEFNIANNGLYSILVYLFSDKRYYNIFNGGSNAIKQGKDVNAYTATCSGTELSLTINGVLAKKIKDSKYRLRDGKIGLGVSSFDVIPILVQVDELTVSQP